MYHMCGSSTVILTASLDMCVTQMSTKLIEEIIVHIILILYYFDMELSINITAQHHYLLGIEEALFSGSIVLYG